MKAILAFALLGLALGLGYEGTLEDYLLGKNTFLEVNFDRCGLCKFTVANFDQLIIQNLTPGDWVGAKCEQLPYTTAGQTSGFPSVGAPGILAMFQVPMDWDEVSEVEPDYLFMATYNLDSNFDPIYHEETIFDSDPEYYGNAIIHSAYAYASHGLDIFDVNKPTFICKSYHSGWRQQPELDTFAQDGWATTADYVDVNIDKCITTDEYIDEYGAVE